MSLELKEGSRRTACATTWTDPRSFATTLVILLHDTYGPEAYTWHPDTVLLEIRDDFRVEPPRANFDRLMAGVSLVTTDSFYVNLPDFVTLCTILSGGVFDPSTLDLADADECAWGVTEALLLSPPDEENDSPFSDEILAYIGKVLDREGIINPPDILRLGIREGDLAARVQADFTDDPAMFSAIYAQEADKTREINDLVRGNLALLTQQLGRLRLDNGDAVGLASRLSKNL